MSMRQAGTPRTGYYVELDEKLPTKPKTQRIVDLSGQPVGEVVYRLYQFWTWVQQQGVDYEGDTGILPGVSLQALVRVCGADERLWAALADPQVDWARFEPQGIVVPGFERRFSRAARRRRSDSHRKQEQRAAGKSGSVDQGLDLPFGERPFEHSIFDSLAEADLGQPSRLLVWFEQAAQERRPVVANDDATLKRVIAAGRAAQRGKEPIAFFKWIVGKRKWDVIKDHELQEASFWVDKLAPREAVQKLRRTVAGEQAKLAARFGIKHA